MRQRGPGYCCTRRRKPQSVVWRGGRICCCLRRRRWRRARMLRRVLRSRKKARGLHWRTRSRVACSWQHVSGCYLMLVEQRYVLISDNVASEGGECSGGADGHQEGGREAHGGSRLQMESLLARLGYLFIFSRLFGPDSARQWKLYKRCFCCRWRAANPCSPRRRLF